MPKSTTMNVSLADSELKSDKMQIAHDRLVKLHGKASENEVYGQVATYLESLTENLTHWKAHPENTTSEQRAMAPPSMLFDDEAIAAYWKGASRATFELDSYSS